MMNAKNISVNLYQPLFSAGNAHFVCATHGFVDWTIFFIIISSIIILLMEFLFYLYSARRVHFYMDFGIFSSQIKCNKMDKLIELIFGLKEIL